jgi:hypothetical protein
MDESQRSIYWTFTPHPWGGGWRNIGQFYMRENFEKGKKKEQN